MDLRYGARLRALREDRGFTQADMVERMQRGGVEYMNTSTLSRIESGVRPVRLSEAKAISAIFRVDIDDMTEGDDAFALQQSRHRYARQRYAAFRDDVGEVTRSQIDMELRHLPLLRELLAGESNATVRAKIELAIKNVESYLDIDLPSEAAERARSIREEFARTGRLPDRDEYLTQVLDDEHQATS